MLEFAEWFRFCVHCLRPKGRISFLCPECWQLLWASCPAPTPIFLDPLFGFPIQSRFVWSPKNETLLRPLVYGLKGGGVPGAFQQLAAEFSYHLRSQRAPQAFVYPPGSQKSVEMDHAEALAKAMAQSWGCPAEDLFVNHSRHVQKQVSREQRQSRHFNLLREPSAGLSSFVFVDDVMTTGATARAAFRALREPCDFRAWVLVYRPRLAEKSEV